MLLFENLNTRYYHARLLKKTTNCSDAVALEAYVASGLFYTAVQAPLDTVPITSLVSDACGPSTILHKFSSPL